MVKSTLVTSRITRRQLLTRSALLAAGAASGASLLAACGGGGKDAAATSAAGLTSPPSPAQVQGSAVYLNYPGWIGSNNVADFHKQYPGAEIKESASGFESTGGVAQTVAQNPKAYDLVLCYPDIVERLDAAKLLLPIDEQIVPALANVDPRIRQLLPKVMPIDTDSLGIGYRKDMVPNPPRTWGEFWRMVPNYNQKVVFVGIDRTALGIALIYKGFKADSTDPAQLQQATDALLEIKPHVQAFKVSDLSQPLADGSAAMAVGYNYETVTLMADNPNIDFIFPEDGTVSFIESIAAINTTDTPEVALAFMDFMMQPPNYANFINTTRAARVSNVADSMIDKVLLSPLMDYPKNTTLLSFPGTEGTEAITQAWQKFQTG